jgi:hypothetical protein
MSEQGMLQIISSKGQGSNRFAETRGLSADVATLNIQALEVQKLGGFANFI